MAARHDAAHQAPPQPLTEAQLERNAKILARVLYRDLRSRGFTKQQIIAIVAELIQCVIAEMDAPRAS